MLRVRLTLKAGQLGTKGPLARYGKRLVCVLNRYDEQTHQRVKAVELIEDRKDGGAINAPRGGENMVAVRVGWQELDLRRKVEAADDPAKRLWVLSRERVEALRLASRIVEGAL